MYPHPVPPFWELLRQKAVIAQRIADDDEDAEAQAHLIGLTVSEVTTVMRGPLFPSQAAILSPDPTLRDAWVPPAVPDAYDWSDWTPFARVRPCFVAGWGKPSTRVWGVHLATMWVRADLNLGWVKVIPLTGGEARVELARVVYWLGAVLHSRTRNEDGTTRMLFLYNDFERYYEISITEAELVELSKAYRVAAPLKKLTPAEKTAALEKTAAEAEKSTAESIISSQGLDVAAGIDVPKRKLTMEWMKANSARVYPQLIEALDIAFKLNADGFQEFMQTAIGGERLGDLLIDPRVARLHVPPLYGKTDRIGRVSAPPVTARNLTILRRLTSALK